MMNSRLHSVLLGLLVALCVSMPTLLASASELIGPDLDDFDRETGERGWFLKPLNYELFRPPSHADREELPLVVFLHGFTDGFPNKQDRLNETMEDLIYTTQGRNELRSTAPCDGGACDALNEELAAYVLVPKIPVFRPFTPYLPMVNRLINDVARRNNVATDEISVIGYSEGGDAALQMGERYPWKFDSVVPLAAIDRTDIEPPRIFDDSRYWFFHSEADDTVDPSVSLGRHEELLAAGFDSQITLSPGGTHNSAYEVPFGDAAGDFYPWLLRTESSVVVPEPGALVLALAGLAGIGRRRSARDGS